MTDGLAVHLGEVPPHVEVKPFGLGGLTAGFAVFCGECGQTAAAYLSHIRADPECVARWVRENERCGQAEGG